MVRAMCTTHRSGPTHEELVLQQTQKAAQSWMRKVAKWALLVLALVADRQNIPAFIREYQRNENGSGRGCVSFLSGLLWRGVVPWDSRDARDV